MSFVLVTGIGRSNLAMVGGILHLCGARAGRIATVPRWDGRGSFENTEIRDSVVKPFLYGINADVRGQNPLPDETVCNELAPVVAPTWRRRVDAIIETEESGIDVSRFDSTAPGGIRREFLYDGPFFYLGALSCLVWPVWALAYPDALWIIVRRDDDQLVATCTKTKYMNGYNSPLGWRQWIAAHKERFSAMKAAGLDIRELSQEGLMAGQFEPLRALVRDRLNLRWDRQQVEDFIAPILWKSGTFAIAEEV